MLYFMTYFCLLSLNTVSGVFGAHQQQLQTIAENEPISSLPLSTHGAVDSALYKSTIDTDIDISVSELTDFQRSG